MTLSTVGTPTPHAVQTSVQRADAPRLLEFSWGGNDMRWELEPLSTGKATEASGTRLTLWRQGTFVGSDEMGNKYYAQTKGVGSMGMQRRWVTYTDLADASKVTPDWHAWLHHMVDTPPTNEAYTPKSWQKPHQMNMTGSGAAYRPSGSILGSGERPKATGDYKPWRPV